MQLIGDEISDDEEQNAKVIEEPSTPAGTEAKRDRSAPLLSYIPMMEVSRKPTAPLFARLLALCATSAADSKASSRDITLASFKAAMAHLALTSTVVMDKAALSSLDMSSARTTFRAAVLTQLRCLLRETSAAVRYPFRLSRRADWMSDVRAMLLPQVSPQTDIGITGAEVTSEHQGQWTATMAQVNAEMQGKECTTFAEYCQELLRVCAGIAGGASAAPATGFLSGFGSASATGGFGTEIGRAHV